MKKHAAIVRNRARSWCRARWSLVVQYGKFGLVGLVATFTHVGVFAMIMERHEIPALIANLLAYSIAVFVSYSGNYKWTFVSAAPGKEAFPRFVIVSLVGLGLNSLAVWGVVEMANLHYIYVLPVMLFIVPVIVFILSRQWAFASSQR